MRNFEMLLKLGLVAAVFAATIFSNSTASAQFGGVQVQVGGYGSGLRIGNGAYGYGGNYNGYGNGYYGNNYYGNGYYGNGYGSRFGNYSNGYYGNGGYYNSYPYSGYGYGVQRGYSVPYRGPVGRRYRYR
jgi:hypothetical protein